MDDGYEMYSKKKKRRSDSKRSRGKTSLKKVKTKNNLNVDVGALDTEFAKCESAFQTTAGNISSVADNNVEEDIITPIKKEDIDIVKKGSTSEILEETNIRETKDAQVVKKGRGKKKKESSEVTPKTVRGIKRHPVCKKKDIKFIKQSMLKNSPTVNLNVLYQDYLTSHSTQEKTETLNSTVENSQVSVKPGDTPNLKTVTLNSPDSSSKKSEAIPKKPSLGHSSIKPNTKFNSFDSIISREHCNIGTDSFGMSENNDEHMQRLTKPCRVLLSPSKVSSMDTPIKKETLIPSLIKLTNIKHIKSTPQRIDDTNIIKLKKDVTLTRLSNNGLPSFSQKKEETEKPATHRLHNPQLKGPKLIVTPRSDLNQPTSKATSSNNLSDTQGPGQNMVYLVTNRASLNKEPIPLVMKPITYSDIHMKSNPNKSGSESSRPTTSPPASSMSSKNLPVLVEFKKLSLPQSRSQSPISQSSPKHVASRESVALNESPHHRPRITIAKDIFAKVPPPNLLVETPIHVQEEAPKPEISNSYQVYMEYDSKYAVYMSSNVIMR